jgi:hypothetical protein
MISPGTRTGCSPANYNLKKRPMNKKPPISRSFKPKPRTRSALPSWHNGADAEIHVYARSLQKAAKRLVEKLEQEQSARTDWDVCPVVFLYREALELHLKALVGEGSSFLKSRTDPISLSRTRSLRWLAQIVCQIIRTVGCPLQFPVLITFLCSLALPCLPAPSV